MDNDVERAIVRATEDPMFTAADLLSLKIALQSAMKNSVSQEWYDECDRLRQKIEKIQKNLSHE